MAPPPSESDIAEALLSLVKTVTVDDVFAVGKLFAKLVGGHAQAAEWHQARAAAVQEAINLSEELRIAQERDP